MNMSQNYSSSSSPPSAAALCSTTKEDGARDERGAQGGGTVAESTCCCVLGPRQTTLCAEHDLVRPGPASVAPLHARKQSLAFLAHQAAAGQGGKRFGQLEDIAHQICAALRVTQAHRSGSGRKDRCKAWRARRAGEIKTGHWTRVRPLKTHLQ